MSPAVVNSETPRHAERRAPDLWVLEITDLNHQKIRDELPELELARETLIERVAGNEWVLKASIRSKRNPMRVLYYYYGGILHNLDRRIAPHPDLEDGRNIPQ